MPARFVDKRDITSVDQLTDVQREQLRLAGIAYDGDELSAEERLAGDPDEEELDGSFQGFCSLWRVVDGDVHLYDAWLYMVDSGSFFRANTTEEVGGIIQFGLEVSDPEIEAQLGPAMVEAKLLPSRDSEYERFAEMLRAQQG